MREAEVRRLLAANLLCALAIVLTAVAPAFFLDGFSVLGTHLTWLCVCSVCVATLNIILHLVLKPNQSPKRRSFAHKAWIRVFSKNGAMSIWESSLQITSVCSILGAWFGAFPIPLDWDRPWQVWPISCSLGATFGYMAGLIIAPLWIHWNRKQLTYKSR